MRLGVYSTTYLNLAPPTIPLWLLRVTAQKRLSTWDKNIEQRSNALTTLMCDGITGANRASLLGAYYEHASNTINTSNTRFNTRFTRIEDRALIADEEPPL